MFVLELTTAVGESQTVDEGVHLSAGYSYFKTRDFRMNPEHPPFAKLVAALPLLFLDLKDVRSFSGWQEVDEWKFAHQFLYGNTERADTILLLGRLSGMVMSLILGLVLFLWAKEIFGVLVAFFALFLYAFDPNMIAHSRYVTTDAPLALFFVLTMYLFMRFIRNPSATGFLAFALSFALAQATKFSALILVPTLIILFLVLSLRYPKLRSLKQFTIHFAILAAITFLVLFGLYSFEVKQPITDYRVQELLIKRELIVQSGAEASYSASLQNVIRLSDPGTSSGRRFLSSLQWHIPSYSYIRGFIQLASHNAGGHTSYLFGHSSDFGWWYYFPLAMLVKTPVSFLLFLLVSAVALFMSTVKKHFEVLWILAPFIIGSGVYLLVSMTSHLNLGVRHVLPIYPLLYIIAAHVTVSFVQKRPLPVFRISIAALLLFYLFSSLSIFPHYLAYFNEIAGGPAGGTRYLLDSNIDWGQDVKKLHAYLQKHSIPFVCMAYFGQASLDYYGIDYRYIPKNAEVVSNDLNCVYVVSATLLFPHDSDYAWLRQYTPTEKIGYSLYLYDFRKNALD